MVAIHQVRVGVRGEHGVGVGVGIFFCLGFCMVLLN